MSLPNRESIRRQLDRARAYATLERANQALAERAGLEGVLLTARELAHRLKNDLAIPVGRSKSSASSKRSALSWKRWSTKR